MVEVVIPTQKRPGQCPDQVHDLELLLHAHHPLIFAETVELERMEALLKHVASKLGLPFYSWDPHNGLMSDMVARGEKGSEKPLEVLQRVRDGTEAVYHFTGFGPYLEEAPVAALLREVHRNLYQHRGAAVFSGSDVNIPNEVDPLFTHFQLEAPSPELYHAYISMLLKDMATRMPVRVELDGAKTNQLIQHLRGLTLFEVRKIITRAVVEDGKLDIEDLDRILEAKKDIIERTGVLEYHAAEESMRDIAGLSSLKAWLRKRKNAFAEPQKAKEFGLSPPRGLLLLGVQGCGKSLCAKAVASEWHMPLIRLDPSNLYNRYYGESEKNLRRAIQAAEGMAPVVLWIDEIEKAFGGSGGSGESGTSQRIFGTFLSWLNDKKESVFVIATANDVSRLPPELLRKGRFDEIFFVDLPNADVRKQILGVHLSKRGRAPGAFALDALAQATEGFSGAEIEQVVVSALYTAFSDTGELSNEVLLNEIKETKPLSTTMREKVDDLRAWARDRAVPAD